MACLPYHYYPTIPVFNMHFLAIKMLKIHIVKYQNENLKIRGTF